MLYSPAGSQWVHDDITVKGSTESIVINTPQLHCGALAVSCPHKVQTHINAGKVATRTVCVCVCVYTCVIQRERGETDMSSTFCVAIKLSSSLQTF